MKKLLSPAIYSIALITIGLATNTWAQGQKDEIDEYLEKFYKPVKTVKKAKNKYQDDISCVDINHQPASEGSDWKGQPEPPSAALLAQLNAPVVSGPSSALCPSGTVEMVLPTRRAIVAAGGLKNFFAKDYWAGNDKFIPNAELTPEPAIPGQSRNGWGYSYHAVAQQSVDATAAETTFSVWQPQLSSSLDFSLSQIWLTNKYSGGGKVEQRIESGVHVAPWKAAWSSFGGSPANILKQVTPATHPNYYKPRFFIFFHNANSRVDIPQSCHNTECPAFVQTSSALPIGQIVSEPYSILGGPIKEVYMGWLKDPVSGHWYLFTKDSVGNFIQVGYYKKEYFYIKSSGDTLSNGPLNSHAARIDIGGEVLQYSLNNVYDLNSLNPEKRPIVRMGSSVGNHPASYPDRLIGQPMHLHVAYHRNVSYLSKAAGVVMEFAPTWTPGGTPTATTSFCSLYGMYGARGYPNSLYYPGTGYVLFFGGDGYGGSGPC